MRKKILAPSLVPVPDSWVEQPNEDLLKDLQDELKKVADLYLHKPLSYQEWTEEIKGINILAGQTIIDEGFLKNADSLEMIQTFGIGYDKIDIRACSKKGVIVCNVAEIYSEPVAQHAWALILDLTKKVTKADRYMRNGKWRSEDWMGVQLWGKTLGIIGLGSNGSRIALKGRLAFDMKILAYDPYILQARAQRYGAELVSLDRLLKDSDVISINTPLTDETRHIIGRNELSMMKTNVILVNTSRGAVVDQKALIECLNKGEIKSAGLDVFEEEPLSQDNPLLKMENVVLTPHIASSTVYAVENTFRKAVLNILTYIEGKKPNWIINEGIYKPQCCDNQDYCRGD